MRALLLGGLLASGQALACSGPGAEEQIVFSELVGWSMFIAAVVMGTVGGVLVWQRGISRRVLAPMMVVILAHPGLWMSARGGDCGHTLKVASVVFTIQALLLVGWILARPRLIAELKR